MPLWGGVLPCVPAISARASVCLCVWLQALAVCAWLAVHAVIVDLSPINLVLICPQLFPDGGPINIGFSIVSDYVL